MLTYSKRNYFIRSVVSLIFIRVFYCYQTGFLQLDFPLLTNIRVSCEYVRACLK